MNTRVNFYSKCLKRKLVFAKVGYIAIALNKNQAIELQYNLANKYIQSSLICCKCY